MKLIQNLTPESLQQCGIAACPQIHKTDQDSYVVVGRFLTPDGIGLDSAKVGPDEVAIEIPAELLANINKA